MEWIKKNPHLVALAVLALALVACCALVFLNTQGFNQNFAKVTEQVPPGQKIDILELKPLEAAEGRLTGPAQWVGKSLFVPDRYVIDEKTNLPKKVIDATFYKHSRTKEDIPNSWFEQNRLPLQDTKVQFSDTDKDGFSAEDEWLWKTDPNKAESHPPYYKELFLKQFIKIPFRLLFQAYDGDVNKPAEMSFQINAVDRGRKTEFLKIGETVANTKYQLKSFAQKSVKNPKTDEDTDVSELTVLNTETQETTVLPLTKMTDSPDSFALFIYEWPVGTRQPIQVKKTGEFLLLPEKEKDKHYKLLDINDSEAVILTPAGEKVSIGRDSRL